MTPTDGASPKNPILLIDDDPRALSALDITLRAAGFDNLVLCATADDVEAAAGRSPYSLVIIDLNTPLASAGTILDLLGRLSPKPEILALAGTPWSRAARQTAASAGIDFLLKPVDRERLLAAAHRALGLS